MVLGIGSGDPIDAPDHVAYGFPNLGVRDRRTHMGETVAAVKALFRGEPYSGGTHVPAISGPLLPPPVRDGGPPVWLGGQGDQVVRLAGGLADGWNGWGMAPEAFRGKVDTLEEEAGALGREVEATWAGIVVVGEDEADAERISAGRKDKGIMGDAFSGSAEHFAEFVRQLADERATWVIVVLAGPADRRELVAEKVLPALAAG
jgi:alkanesulfonate monooxygenase SsuD/methylene tetrahydromethanopterin reductase-like flavin-dependent oxidoreductase (luciferase family)